MYDTCYTYARERPVQIYDTKKLPYTSTERYFSVYTKKVCLQLVRINKEYSDDFVRVIKGMLMIVGTHTALGNAY